MPYPEDANIEPADPKPQWAPKRTGIQEAAWRLLSELQEAEGEVDLERHQRIIDILCDVFDEGVSLGAKFKPKD